MQNKRVNKVVNSLNDFYPPDEKRGSDLNEVNMTWCIGIPWVFPCLAVWTGQQCFAPVETRSGPPWFWWWGLEWCLVPWLYWLFDWIWIWISFFVICWIRGIGSNLEPPSLLWWWWWSLPAFFSRKYCLKSVKKHCLIPLIQSVRKRKPAELYKK